MRVDGTPGNVYLRWSGGKLQFVNLADHSVIMSVDPVGGAVEQAKAKITEARLEGQVFLASGEVLASADELNDAGRGSHYLRAARGNLAAAAAADGIVFAWENQEGADVIVYRVIVDVTTAGGTATATLDVGEAVDAVTGSNSLITAADLNAVATYDSLDLAGAGVATFVKVPDGEFITGQAKTEKAEALVGKYYVFYALV
jgi:hypothetical protein